MDFIDWIVARTMGKLLLFVVAAIVLIPAILFLFVHRNSDSTDSPGDESGRANDD